MPAIDVTGVTKRYGDVTALQDLDLTVRDGEVFGFLGPNGAGKSTTIDILLDYVRPTSGRAEVLGHDAQRSVVEIRDRIGVLPDDFEPIGRRTGREHVAFAVESKASDDDPEDVLERVGIADAADREAVDYSSGMTQRLALGMALVGDPDLLILDEPTSGLDPNGIRRMREIVREETDRGTTVFFSSHVLEQVEAVADRVGILRQGELVALDTIDALRTSVGSGSQLRVTLDRAAEESVAAVEDVEGVTSVTTDEDTLTVACEDRVKIAVLDAVRDAGATVLDFETVETSLEELFVSYAGESREAETTAAGAEGEMAAVVGEGGAGGEDGESGETATESGEGSA